MSNIRLYQLLIFFVLVGYANRALSDKNYDCYSEVSISGVVQEKKNFLTESEYFSSYNIFEFNESYSKLREKEKKVDGKLAYNNYFECKKMDIKNLIFCSPVSSINKYIVYFSTKTFRFRKRSMTSFWLNGKEDEIDYIHLSQGSCDLI